MPVITEIARPKINLTLSILGRRADGYHALESLVAFAEGVGDRVTLDTSAAPSLTVTGPFAAEIEGENLVARALALLESTTPVPTLGRVRLEKNLPIASGIGGGSADAAAVLRAVRAANPDCASAIDWLAIAAKLGADVPVCFENRAALMTGIGERLTPIANMPHVPAVLVDPQIAVPAGKTAAVFRALNAPLDQTAPPAADPPASPAALLAAISTGRNELEPAASRLMPAIADVLLALRVNDGLVLARLSGAGPTCFGIYETQQAAATAAQALSARHPAWWIAPVMLG